MVIAWGCCSTFSQTVKKRGLPYKYYSKRKVNVLYHFQNSIQNKLSIVTLMTFSCTHQVTGQNLLPIVAIIITVVNKIQVGISKIQQIVWIVYG